MEPAVALFIFIPSTQKARAVDLWVQDQAGLHSESKLARAIQWEPISKKEMEEPEEDA